MFLSNSGQGAFTTNKEDENVPPGDQEIVIQFRDLIFEERFHKGEYEFVCSFVLLVPEKNGKWRMWVDSRSINKITDMFPILLLENMLDVLGSSKVFLKIDIHSS